MKLIKGNTRIVAALPLVLIALLISGNPAAAADETTRKTTTAQGLASDGGAAADTDAGTDEYERLVIAGDRNQSAGNGAKQKVTSSAALLANTDFWFYAADVELFLDRDRDGYYTGINLLFDADTNYEIADVYAVVYLSFEYGPWNEYAETEIFTIFGASSDDEYVVETDLVEGYPTGNYDILIELYDAYDDAFVASFGPADTSELAILPLEDFTRDSSGGSTQVVVTSGGGGSLSWTLILILLGAGALRGRR